MHGGVQGSILAERRGIAFIRQAVAKRKHRTGVSAQYDPRYAPRIPNAHDAPMK
jgi:hypothetical protein